MHKLLIAVAAVFFAATAFAYGPHDNSCVECHSLHYAKGDSIIGIKPNTMEKNPSTGAGASDDISLCLGCHNDDEGIMPILLSSTHPVGMKPGKVKVPAELLTSKGTLGCVSCHDPHPSNPNYQYLRGDVKKSGQLGKFCALCHKEKVDMSEFAPKKEAAAPAPKKQ